MVWKREYSLSNKAVAFNAKLAPKFRGPLEVRRIISPIDLRNKSGWWTRHIHIQDMKPALTDESPAKQQSDEGGESEEDRRMNRDRSSNINESDYNDDVNDDDDKEFPEDTGSHNEN